MRADGSKNLWIVRSFIIHNRFFLYPFIFSFVHLKRRLKWRAIIKVDLPVGMVFPLLPNLSFPCVTWCGAAICKQKISLQKSGLIQLCGTKRYPEKQLAKRKWICDTISQKRDQMRKVIMYETYACSLQK